jgi:acyl-ACP thioesterase
MPEMISQPENNFMPPFHEKKFVVQYHETDRHGFVRLVALLNYLQTTAIEHAAQLKVSVADLHKSGHTWVLSRVHLAMARDPRGGEIITIRTWPAERITFFSVRDYTWHDADGKCIGRATTSWAVLNIASRRPVKLSEVLPEFPLSPQRAIDDAFETLPVLENSQHNLVLPVLRGDLDANRHVNNTVYAAWALETIPEEVDNRCRLASIEIAFRAEALYGDTIVARTASGTGENCYLHRIESKQNGRELARLRTRWVTI